MKVKVRIFAGLKDFFPSSIEMELEAPDIASVYNELLQSRPDAGKLLELCRFAAGNEFVEKSHIINAGETISFLPPSSGG